MYLPDDDETSACADTSPDSKDSAVAPLSPEFYSQFTQVRNREMWDIFYKAGLRIKDDGSIKFHKAIFKSAIEETLVAWHEGLITKDEMKEFIVGLGNKKLTRYKLESDLASRRRKAGKS